MIVALASISLALVVMLDCVATRRIARTDVYSSSQKTAQILIIWLIPIVGSIVVLSVLKAAAPSRGYSDAEFPDLRVVPGNTSPGEPLDFGGSDSSGPMAPNHRFERTRAVAASVNQGGSR